MNIKHHIFDNFEEKYFFLLDRFNLVRSIEQNSEIKTLNISNNRGLRNLLGSRKNYIDLEDK